MSQRDATSHENIASGEWIVIERLCCQAENWKALPAQLYIIADVLADGIVKQFPQKFYR
jgi:hypothetical protein